MPAEIDERPWTFAIVGLGMALAPHMAGLRDLGDRARLAHAVARSAARRKAFHAQHGLHATGDLDAAITDPSVDAVILLTPPDSHLALGTRILGAGKHLLIEKPAGLRTEDARELAAMARARGLLAAPVLQHRFRPSVRAAERLAASGELGNLCGVNCLVPWWRPQSYYDEPGRGSFARDGGGVLLTQAIHTLDVLRALCGHITIKAAQVRTSPIHAMEAEDMVCALGEFGPHGAPGTIMATTSSFPGFSEIVTLIYERATVRLGARGMEAFHHDGRTETVRDDSGGGHHVHHRALLSAFVDAMDGPSALPVDLFDLVRTRELIDEMLAVRVGVSGR